MKLETGLRPGFLIHYSYKLRVEAIGFPTFGLLLYLPEPSYLSCLAHRIWKLGAGRLLDVPWSWKFHCFSAGVLGNLKNPKPPKPDHYKQPEVDNIGALIVRIGFGAYSITYL